MNVHLDQIKKLRFQTKAGVLNCRQALQESRGDLEKAKRWLRKKGMATVAKKKDRTVKAGIVEAYIHAGKQVGALVKLSCETDFVSKTKEFKNLAHELAMQVAAMNPKNISELLEQDSIRDSKQKVKDLVNQLIAKMAENVRIEAISRLKI
ncbi:MAG TPA: translation elongation factor Ts [Candidatus Bathyarchaeia archaeon]|nr:translation elongation factor Ts [Candidatus Bathyarchaeia archaeon]